MAKAIRVIIHSDRADRLAGQLCAAHPGIDLRCCDTYAGMDALVPEFRPDAVFSVRFGGMAGFPRDALLGPGGPGWISVGGSGVDHLAPWDAGSVTVTNAAGVASGAMAEYALGAFLHFALDVPGLLADKAARRWDAARSMTPLAGRTVLVVGLGRTGRAVATRAAAMGMRVIGVRARPGVVPGVAEIHAPADLPALWPRADFIAVCVPLLASTRGMVGAEAFAAMKSSAVLVDVSRGGVIDHDALLDALGARRIQGAALDVFPAEPLPAASPLWQMDNVLLSPHSSAVFDGWEDAAFAMFLDNLGRWLDGRPLENVVDPVRGY